MKFNKMFVYQFILLMKNNANNQES